MSVKEKSIGYQNCQISYNIEKYVAMLAQNFGVLNMKSTCFIKNKLRNYKNFKILNSAQKRLKIV